MLLNSFGLFSQKLASMLEYDMRTTAHYRFLASKNLNCTFAPKDIVLDKYTITSSLRTESVLADGTYCFKYAGYDPSIETYSLWSEPRIYIVNNTG
jgi:hypothetical protein